MLFLSNIVQCFAHFTILERNKRLLGGVPAGYKPGTIADVMEHIEAPLIYPDWLWPFVRLDSLFFRQSGFYKETSHN